VYSSIGILKSDGVEKAIFLADKKSVPTIFGKEVSEERFNEVWDKIKKLFNGWFPVFHNAFELYLQAGNDWKKVDALKIVGYNDKDLPHKAWKDMPAEALAYIRSLPEFDENMFEKITGLNPK